MDFDLSRFQADFNDSLAILQNIFIWNANLHGITDNSAIIQFYLYLFPSLTQVDISDLTHLSRGLISVLLKNLQKHQLITRRFITGTHRYSYALRDPQLPFQFSYDCLIDEAVSLITAIKDFITTDLPNIDHPFVHRVRDLLSFYETRQKILEIERNITISVQNNLNTQIIPEKLYQDRKARFPKRETNTFISNLEIRLNTHPWLDVYKKFLTTMTAHSFLMISDPITKRIMACFIAEDCQTQTLLGRYTGYSGSTIHRYLKRMIDSGLIKQNSIKYHGQLTYEMEQVTLMETSYEKKYKQRMTGELPILKKIVRDMDQSPNSWVFLPGFAYIYTLIQRVIRFLNKYCAIDKKKNVIFFP